MHNRQLGRIILGGFMIISLAGFELSAGVQPAVALASLTEARKLATPAARVGKSLTRVPWAAAGLLKLPLGATQIVLSPLPGITMTEGIGNIGHGLLAPFDLAATVLKVPLELTSAITGN